MSDRLRIDPLLALVVLAVIGGVVAILADPDARTWYGAVFAVAIVGAVVYAAKKNADSANQSSIAAEKSTIAVEKLEGVEHKLNGDFEPRVEGIVSNVVGALLKPVIDRLERGDKRFDAIEERGKARDEKFDEVITQLADMKQLIDTLTNCEVKPQ